MSWSGLAVLLKERILVIAYWLWLLTLRLDSKTFFGLGSNKSAELYQTAIRPLDLHTAKQRDLMEEEDGASQQE